MGRPLISSLCETWELRCYSRYKHQLVDENEGDFRISKTGTKLLHMYEQAKECSYQEAKYR